MSRTNPSSRDDRLRLDEFDQTKTQYPTVSGTGPFVYILALDPESPKPIQNRFYCKDAQIDTQFYPPYPSFVDVNDTNTSSNDHIGPGLSMTRWISSNELCHPSLFNMDCEQLTTAETVDNNSDGISGFAPTMASPHDPTTTAMGSTLSGQPYPSTTVPGGGSSNNFELATLSWFTQDTSSPSMTQTASNTAVSPRSSGHSASSKTNSIIYTPPSPKKHNRTETTGLSNASVTRGVSEKEEDIVC
ncbi:hypothetical protein F5883DRAFT_243369 [Diaporthe sp. PMI_573]|nr:hypothetical protein F5883DRAFT_243369 [Diaporthaceae sp. PMI_573]